MSKVAEWFTDKIASDIANKSDKALEINEIFQFNIEGEGGGTWTINLKEGPAVTEGGNDDATCVLTMAADDFLGLVNGDRSGMELFATGKLRIERDAMAAMKLEKLMTM